MTYEFDSESGRIAMAFRSGRLHYRVHFGINGFNDLPNFIGVDRSDDGEHWVTVNSAKTDWLPPLRVAAAHNGDGSGKFATGGNHGNVEKKAKGDRTARNTLFQIRADGALLTESASGTAKTIDMTVSNRIMGWNTTPLVMKPRYIMRQTFQLRFQAGGCEVRALLEPLEEVLLARDSALQTVNTGFQEKMFFYGKSVEWEPYKDGTSSGAKADAPDVIGVGLFSETNGQMTVWLDREWEAGRGMMLLDAHPLVRISGGKSYLAVALDVNEHQTDIGTTVSLTPGQIYRYRGGYSWYAPSASVGNTPCFYRLLDGNIQYVSVADGGKLAIS
jgi:hypothetical protein